MLPSPLRYVSLMPLFYADASLFFAIAAAAMMLPAFRALLFSLILPYVTFRHDTLLITLFIDCHYAAIAAIDAMPRAATC